VADFPGDLLTLPPTAGAVAVARVLLGRAVEARARLHAPDEAEALHNFRVALRRLRSCLRAYWPYLSDAVPKRMRRQLSDVAAGTGAGRDAEVQLGWVGTRASGVARAERAGVTWFTEHTQQRLAAHAQAVRDGARRFDRIARSLRGRLHSAAPATPEQGGAPDRPTFGSATGALVLEHAAEVSVRLAAVASVSDEEEAHLARIRAKRLRYLLEPIIEFRPDASVLVERLKALQDLLGDLHDMHVLAHEIAGALERAAVDRVRMLEHAVAARAGPARRARLRRVQPGLFALLRQTVARQRELFAVLEAEWLGARAEALVHQAEALGHALSSAGAAPVEIERKFLLKDLPSALRDAASVEVRQGWLPGTVLQERLRCVAEPAGARYYRTVKSGTGVVRVEIEEETSAELFERLWPLTEGRRVLKRRYYRQGNGLQWEVDVFVDRELVLAEVELPSAETRVELPGWLSESVVREVTGEPEYVNVNLAR
jgi:CHAD domain-containing protein/CYTH domain-containing protein